MDKSSSYYPFIPFYAQDEQVIQEITECLLASTSQLAEQFKAAYEEEA